MKSPSVVFLLAVLRTWPASVVASHDDCSGRWQIVDKLNVKITIDWEISLRKERFVTEFRASHIGEGFWSGFGLSSTSNEPSHGLVVYALRRHENDSEVFWNVYNVTESKVFIVEENLTSIVAFQRLPASGLLTMHSTLQKQPCSYFVYMQGRLEAGQPLPPDEVRPDRSACLTCPSSSTTTRPSSPMRSKRKANFLWFGRILNRSWSNEYSNLSSPASEQLRLELQNQFLSLINSNASLSFICDRFELYALESGSILFASNITLISNLSEDQTIDFVDELIKTVNDSMAEQFELDPSVHQFTRAANVTQINELLKRYASPPAADIAKRAEFDSALHLLIGCISAIGLLMMLISSILCLYGYYKCRRQQFRRFTEQPTLKFKPDINAYAWLGQQPAISCSSPYLIQSTSI